jgi:hypothetical protein
VQWRAREERRAVVKSQEVNWEKYFQHIKPVCPWSGAAHKKGEIKFVEWSGELEPLGKNQAIVYICQNYNRRRLKKLHKKLDTGEFEILWSEPTNGPNGAPVPVIIQQDKRKLFDLRFDTGYYDDIIG